MKKIFFLMIISMNTVLPMLRTGSSVPALLKRSLLRRNYNTQKINYTELKEKYLRRSIQCEYLTKKEAQVLQSFHERIVDNQLSEHERKLYEDYKSSLKEARKVGKAFFAAGSMAPVGEFLCNGTVLVSLQVMILCGAMGTMFSGEGNRPLLGNDLYQKIQSIAALDEKDPFFVDQTTQITNQLGACDINK